MEKYITYETLRSFCYTNEKICRLPIRGIVVSFYGLGKATVFWEDPEEAKLYAENGILYVIPYNNPWAWLNRQALGTVEEILDLLFLRYGLPEDTPVVSLGNSMGGMSALDYMVYAKRTPAACLANCPVCDMIYHEHERPDLPRTLYSAFYHEEGTMKDALLSRSPIHLIDRMPDVPYYIFHCTADTKVDYETHSVRFVKAMKEAGKDVTFFPVPGRDHCDLPPEENARYLGLPVEIIDRLRPGK